MDLGGISNESLLISELKYGKAFNFRGEVGHISVISSAIIYAFRNYQNSAIHA